MSKLISFIIPSRYPENIRDFFDNIQQTTLNAENVEVLVKFDDDQQEIVTWLEQEKLTRPFHINYLLTPRIEGVYSGAIAVEQLFHLSSGSYFIQILSDEPRFLTMHWDQKLSRYKHFFKDDIFRLRLSTMKYKNYCSHYECTFQPDSFPIYTRRWLELTEGTGDCWGSDAYQQCVAFHLSLGPKSYFNFYREQTYWRDIIVTDIEMGGLDFGIGLSDTVKLERDRRNLKEWNRLTSHVMQERFSYLARRLYCGILAAKYNIHEYRLEKRPQRKTVVLLDKQGNELFEVSYAVQRISVYTQNTIRRLYTLPRLSYSRLIKKIRLHKNKRLPASDSKVKSEIVPQITHDHQQLLRENKPMRRKIRRALRTIASPYYIVTNYIDHKILSHHRPGISVITSKNPDLSIGVIPPTTAQIAWLNNELKRQDEQQKALRNKIFQAPDA